VLRKLRKRYAPAWVVVPVVRVWSATRRPIKVLRHPHVWPSLLRLGPHRTLPGGVRMSGVWEMRCCKDCFHSSPMPGTVMLHCSALVPEWAENSERDYCPHVHQDDGGGCEAFVEGGQQYACPGCGRGE
jgi:hypothetical protein